MLRLSLTRRLTLLFTLVAASVVLGLGGLFMTEADRHFMELDRSTLHDKQLLIADILATSRSESEWSGRLSAVLKHHHGLSVTVSSLAGQTLFQTPGMPPHSAPMAPHASAGIASPQRNFETPTLRTVYFEAPTALGTHPRLVVTVAMDAAHHQRFLQELLQALIWYALVAIVVSGLLGWAAVYFGLAPLRAIKRYVGEVTVHRLQPYVPLQSVPSEMAELALTLNRTLERLHQDFRRLSDFASDLAHELRTPINNMLTQTQVTLAAPRDSQSYQDILASNAEELQRLARTVSDMLLLAKTERGVDLPSKERFMAADEAQALIDFYQALADDKQIALTVHGNANVDGDRLMIRRALSNLLSNALRHAPEGGIVKIEVLARPEAIEVAVENSGEDIPPHALPRLFDRFYRVNTARHQADAEGAGLGLAITKAIVEAHGGSIAVTSAQGLTRFALLLPSGAG